MAPAHGAFMPEPTTRVEADPAALREIVAETEHYCMTLALFFEGGSTGESEQGQRHIAQVIVERAKANRRIWGGRTICGVVFHQAKGTCQFSFACLPLTRRTPRPSLAWSLSAVIAQDALAGYDGGADDLIRYYMNADLTPLRNQCRFRREFVPVAKVGRHEFFREPTSTERRELARTEFEACTRYAALLQAEQEKAKKKRHVKKGKTKQKFAKAVGKKKGKKLVRVARAKR
jgi:spore germination cell wall hydrolase CwlJ-like protein